MTLDALLKDEEFATPRFNLVLLSIFAAVGLALAVVGVYGVMSSAVAQERQEIGVRMALGADAGTIARMVLARGARLLLAGTALGLVGSVAAGRWLAGSRSGASRGSIRWRSPPWRAPDDRRAGGVLLAGTAGGAHRPAPGDAGIVIGRASSCRRARTRRSADRFRFARQQPV